MSPRSVLVFILLQQGIFGAILRPDEVPKECQEKNTKASNIMNGLSNFVQGSSDVSFLTKISNFFRNDHRSVSENKTMLCLSKIFMGLDSNFHQLSISIQSLKDKLNMDVTLLEARTIMDQIAFVYSALDFYKMHREYDAKNELIKQCNAFKPSNTLIQLHKRVVLAHPRLFDTILRGTEYSETDFENFATVWLKQSTMCAVLDRECEFIRSSNASKELKKSREQKIITQLAEIRDTIIQANESLRIDFVNVTPAIIRREMDVIVSKGYDAQSGVNHIANILERMFPFRAWAVMLYDRIEHSQIDIHAHESSTNNWFFVNDAHHTVIAHGADISLNCSLFMGEIRHKTLKQFFANNEDYAAFSRSEHMGKDIMTIKRLLLEQENAVPQELFISVMRYQKSLVIKQDYDFHRFEHIRPAPTEKFTKSVFIGWC